MLSICCHYAVIVPVVHSLDAARARQVHLDSHQDTSSILGIGLEGLRRLLSGKEHGKSEQLNNTDLLIKYYFNIFGKLTFL